MNLIDLVGSITLKELPTLSRAELLHLLRLRNEEGVRRYMYTCHTISEAEHLAWAAATSNHELIKFYAVARGGQIVGGTQFLHISKEHKRAEWGAYLGSAFQGRALGVALEIAMLDRGFGELGLEKINGEVLAFNDRALNTHRRLGFTAEGLRRRHILREGKWIDVHLLGITREEWGSKRAALFQRLLKH